MKKVAIKLTKTDKYLIKEKWQNYSKKHQYLWVDLYFPIDILDMALASL